MPGPYLPDAHRAGAGAGVRCAAAGAGSAHRRAGRERPGIGGAGRRRRTWSSGREPAAPSSIGTASPSAAAEGVQFLQPGASSVILNRVVQSNAERDRGTPHAPTAACSWSIPAASCSLAARRWTSVLSVASTLDIRDADFLAGRYSFAGAGSGAVVNQGALQAAERGAIALLGGQVSNEGTVTRAPGHGGVGVGQQGDARLRRRRADGNPRGRSGGRRPGPQQRHGRGGRRPGRAHRPRRRRRWRKP
ncbi:MAG: hypothetical protein MZV65_48260 [Chromatiales bacterium]|nr:hypothetical protein [Chromatiales bacterium]